MRPFIRTASMLVIAGAAYGGRPAPHPHFDDGGTLHWYTKLADAQAAAKREGKLVFIEYGRQVCGNCRALAESVLPAADVKARLAALAVGLAADCDAPENAVEQLMRANLSGASALPFVAFVTHDGRWVTGYAGYKDTAGFLKVLDTTERSPVLQATPAVQKKFAALAAVAAKAAEKADWRTVLKAGKDGAKLMGRCPERDALAGHVKAARDWAAARFDAAIRAAQLGGDLAEPKAILAEVKKHFAGEPEAAEADSGARALQKLDMLRAAEAAGTPTDALRDKAVREHRDSRWKAIFEEAPAAVEPATEPSPG
jgi:hypothetical protein